MPEQNAAPSPAPLHYQRNGRSPKAILGVTAYLLLLLVLATLYGAALWIIALMLLPALPAVFELGSNPSAGLTLGPTHLDWHTGRREARVPLDDITNARFDTRLDFSVRVTLTFRDGKSLRLPQESMPPHRDFEDALQNHGVKTERHHFVVF